jgi:hypothetical protein
MRRAIDAGLVVLSLGVSAFLGGPAGPSDSAILGGAPNPTCDADGLETPDCPLGVGGVICGNKYQEPIWDTWGLVHFKYLEPICNNDPIACTAQP